MDDVKHYTIGCIVEYGIYSHLRTEYERFSKGLVAVL